MNQNCVIVSFSVTSPVFLSGRNGRGGKGVGIRHVVPLLNTRNPYLSFHPHALNVTLSHEGQCHFMFCPVLRPSPRVLPS